jgi:hypothetical protein
MMKIWLGIFVVLAMLFTFGCDDDDKQVPSSSFWTDGYCQQKTVQHILPDMKEITYMDDGDWKTLPLVNFPQGFVDWNKESRKGFLDDIRGMMMGGGGNGPELAGPHNGIVATCGYKRDDTSFSLNNAVKGMGFLPKAEKLDEFIALLDSTADAPMPQKLDILTGFYENLEENFDLDKQISLELYSQPEFMTQTFLNQVSNPISTIVFLDIPSYKLKTIVRLLDPKDPTLNDYEKKVVIWINKIHSYFHGPFTVDFMGVVYYTVEVFDNSPMGENPETGMGRRVMPEMP